MAITGIGSGLEINKIVSALVSADGAPKTAQLSRLENATTSKFTALGSFRSALSTFQSVLEKLNSADLYNARSATSGDSKVFSVTADSAASAGSYDLQVFNLAQTSKVALRGQANATDPVGTGTLTLSAGSTSIDVEITEDNNSLSGIRDAINAKSADSGITATVVTDPNGAGGSRLVLSSNTAGTGNDISVAVTTDGSDTGDLGVLAYTPPATTDFEPTPSDPMDPLGPRVVSYARDANLSIDGLAISSASNTVSDAIDGVSITLKKAQSQEDIDAGSTISLSVGLDKSSVRTSLESFVDGYNAMMKSINSLTSVTPVGGDDGEPLAAALVGDASVRSLTAALRTEMGTVAKGDVRILADLGISTKSDGTLEIDSEKLDDALENKFESLSTFLAGDDGLMSRLNAKIEPYTKDDGILEKRTTSLQNTLSGIDDQRERLEARLASLETRLLAQFNAMDTLVAGLSSTSSFLASQLANLPGIAKES